MTESSGIVKLENVRLSFPHIAKPGQSTKSAPFKYSGDFVMGSDHPGWGLFHKTVQGIMVEEWKDKTSAILEVVNSDRKLRCYGAGNEKRNKKTMEVYDGYVDQVYISASTEVEKPPQMIRSDGTSAEPFSEEWMILARKLVGGYWVNAVVRPWLQDNTHGRAIRCNLCGIQFLRKGDSFGRGEEDVSALFGAIPDANADAPAGLAMPDFMG